MAYLPAAKAEPGTEIEIDVRGKTRAGARRAQAAVPTRGGERWLRPRTPTTCCTTPSTTGRGSTATSPRSASPGSRRTRSARSCSSTRPRSARRTTKDESYAEVESVKAVSDVIAPLSRRDRRGQHRAGRRARDDQQRPLRRGLAGEGRLSDPSEIDSLLDQPTYTSQTGLGMSRYTAVTPRRPARRCSRRSASGRSTSSSPRWSPRACASTARSTCPTGLPEQDVYDAPARRWRPRTSRPRTRSRSSAPGCTTRTSRRSSTCS